MPVWVHCKSVGDASVLIAVNLSQVVSLSPTNLGTLVRYAGGSDNEFMVADSVREILDKGREYRG